MFQSDNITYYADQYFPKVTGVLTNSLTRSFSNLRVTAVLYDQSNNIIGGGYTFLNFLPASTKTGFSVSVKSKEKPAKTEIYTTVSGLTSLQGDNSKNDSVKLLAYGYSVKDTNVSVGFLAENNLKDQFIDPGPYHVSVYDESGNVLGVDEGYINTLFPGETSGTSVNVSIPEGKTVGNVEVQIDPGDFSDHFDISANPFSTENVKFAPGTYSSKVTGTLKNSYDQTITYVEVNAVAYDKDGKIIGGGNTYVDFVPAEGQTAFEIRVKLPQAPARIDAYPSFTSITKIGE